MAAARKKTAAPNATSRRGARQEVKSIVWPVDKDGQPMAQISVTASELIPTGQFANVVVGPVTVTKFVEDKSDADLAKQINGLAEVVEVDCLSEQRELVLESLQAAAPDDNK